MAHHTFKKRILWSVPHLWFHKQPVDKLLGNWPTVYIIIPASADGLALD